MQANAFLEQHSARLVEIANGASTALLGDNAVSLFLEHLHADFETVEDKPGRRPSLPGEDVFWWCVTILEELTEIAPFHRSTPRGRPDRCGCRSTQLAPTAHRRPSIARYRPARMSSRHSMPPDLAGRCIPSLHRIH